MKRTWFRRFGWFHIPVSVPGSVLCLLAAVFCAQVFVVVDRHSHSVSDTLYGVFPFFASAFLLLDWVAGRTTERSA
jgi:drug/metabolite transporter (DMT)-like permease